MAAKKTAGRRDKYETHVKPRLSEVEAWCAKGASDADLIHNLDIGRSAFYDYLKKHPELADAIKIGRRKPIAEIKAALLRRAVGYDYQEITERDSDKDGHVKEVRTRHLPPDPASAMILLKHWAKDEGWTNDPVMMELRKKELELKEQAAEEENW